MPDVVFKEFSVNLQNKLSISVPCLLENLVGMVILGYKLFDISVSKNSLIKSRSFIFKRFMLKSAAIIDSVFLFPFL